MNQRCPFQILQHIRSLFGNVVIVLHSNDAFRYPKTASIVLFTKLSRWKWASSENNVWPTSRPSSSVIVSISFEKLSLWCTARTVIDWWHSILNGTMCRVFLSIVCMQGCFNLDSAEIYLWIASDYAERLLHFHISTVEIFSRVTTDSMGATFPINSTTLP